MSTPPLAASGMAPGPFAGPQAQQAAREVNTASLCRIGQETVQDIVYRTMEIFQLLRNMQLPNGVTYHTGTYQDRLAKLQDHLRQLSILFRKLRLVYDKCNENCGGMDPIPVEYFQILIILVLLLTRKDEIVRYICVNLFHMWKKMAQRMMTGPAHLVLLVKRGEKLLKSINQRWRNSIQSAKTRLGADCDSDHELLIAKFRYKLKKVGKTTRPFRMLRVT
ncbi:mediator of RNA polymerase II transcription subunit 30 isoform X2 [Muntiacus reevesi]|uniref:mediator of RNA polymerase II transcription subunit 30 isoform X2 n=1 Tax=Muntiacus reevesi TaxID=9886 RepID=UPI003306AA8F